MKPVGFGRGLSIPAVDPVESTTQRLTQTGSFRPLDGFSSSRATLGVVNLSGLARKPGALSVDEAFPDLQLSRTSPEADLREMVRQNLRTAYGREATEEDYAYWLPKLRSECDSSLVTSGQMTGMDYWHKRMLGWQAGGPDVATLGPYAGQDFGEAPPLVDFSETDTSEAWKSDEKKAKKPSRLKGFENATGAVAKAAEVLAQLDPAAAGGLDAALAELEKQVPGEFTREGDALVAKSGGRITATDGAWQLGA